MDTFLSPDDQLMNKALAESYDMRKKKNGRAKPARTKPIRNKPKPAPVKKFNPVNLISLSSYHFPSLMSLLA